MKRQILKITAMAFILGISGVANAQTWSLGGNNSSNTFEKIGLKDPVDLQFLTDDKVRLSLTQNGWLGLGTLNPEGWQEIFYTPTTYKGDNGLLVTLNSTNQYVLAYDVQQPDLVGGGLFEVRSEDDGPFEGTGGTSNPTFTVPFNFRTGHLTNVATPLYSQNTKPMFWVREKNPPGMNSPTGLEEFHTKFIVMPDGSCGINITNPRAALDVRGSQAPNRPAAIIGSRAIGTNLNDPTTQLDQYYTQMVQFVPVLKENGYNQIVQKDDQGMFFTDGLGADGANGSGAFVLAPWAASGDTAVGGLRMDKFGNTEFHGTLRSTRVKVDAKWWSDFVFADDYKLPSLAEVVAFISTNKHLPNVPSEADVLENGIDIANMQAIQQQKIEELTLYIIQLKKEMDAMTAAMELLK